MKKHRPWQPHLGSLPLFNPFEPSTKWTRELGAGDRIEIEDEEEAEGSVPADQMRTQLTQTLHARRLP
jgi:hypothetical protein